MKLATFLQIKMVVSLGFGLLLLVAPAMLSLVLFGATPDPLGLMFARFVGAQLMGIALLCWLTSQTPTGRAVPEITLALFVADTVGFVVALGVQLEPLAYPMGWVSVATWFLMALGLGYFRFRSPNVAAAAT
ncbi:MAG: hypothetical protein R3C14_09520 [Caldilineaceae bacterium]